MHLETLSDRARIERHLRRDAALHLYELGDLDDFFFPHTSYRALVDGDTIVAMGLLYHATGLPVLVAMGHPHDAANVRALVRALRGDLPARVYGHLAPGTHDALGDAFHVDEHGLHDRMVLVDRSKVDAVDTRGACTLAPSDRAEVEALFARAYPGNWFVPRMLETNTYAGVRRDGVLVAVAGVHVVSRSMRVAALGNVTTDPAHRGQGLGRIATAAVCNRLRGLDVETIGLNVESTNESAIALYRRLGFDRVSSYEEVMITKRG